MLMMNDYEEDLDDFPAENKEKRPNPPFEHISQSRQIHTQQEVEPQRKFHFSLMGRRAGFSTRS